MNIRLYTVIVFLLVSCFSAKIYSQNWALLQDDEEYNKKLNGGLKVGDKMPDIALGKVLNNITGKTMFSEFKDKLIILDFWNTWCSTCIEGFPKMEQLQTKYGNKIQIILVNVDETEDMIKERFDIFKKQAPLTLSLKNKYYLPNLPIIVADSPNKRQVLYELFPVRGIPHHVWIDGKGIIRIRGGSENTYSEKIDQILKGEEIFSKNDLNTTIYFKNNNLPYWKLINYFKNVPLELGSYFTRFNNEYVASGGGAHGINIVDSVTATKRSTFINKEILEMYKLGPFYRFFEEKKQNTIYSSYNNDYGLFPYFILEVKDTLRYTSVYIRAKNYHQLKDIDDIKSKFCYELVVPTSLPEDKQSEIMLEDMNRYFGNLYGTTARLERRKVLCFILVRTSNIDKISSSTSNEYFFNVFSKCISSSYELSEHFADNQRSKKAYILLNETGFNRLRKVKIELQSGKRIKTIEQLREKLQKYDLDIITEEREIEFVLIKE